MIRPLRRAHLLTSTLLAVSVCLILVMGLGNRAKAGTDAVIDASEISRLDAAGLPGAIEDLGPAVENWLVGVRWQRGTNGATFLEVDLGSLPPAPALLLYRNSATGSVPSAGSPLPSGSVFLGALKSDSGLGSGSRRFVTVPSAGTLVLYSLGHGEVVSAAPLLAPRQNEGGES